MSLKKGEGIVVHLMGIIPNSYFGALARGDLLQVLLVLILSGFAIAFLGKAGEQISYAVDQAVKMLFGTAGVPIGMVVSGLSRLTFTRACHFRRDRQSIGAFQPVSAGWLSRPVASTQNDAVWTH
jgi:Na+/H+-dicarboxylate symporter